VVPDILKDSGELGSSSPRICLGMPDPEDRGTPWREKSQTGCYMILKMLGQWNSLKYQDSPFKLIYREVSAVYDSHFILKRSWLLSRSHEKFIAYQKLITVIYSQFGANIMAS
jgi:hypothetical protein